MATVVMNYTTKETLVGMGQIAAGRAPERMKAVLGSCVGLAIYHPRLKTAAVAHIVLPESAGRNGVPGKFADTAVPEMLKLLKELGAPTCGLTAKFAGGGNMFGTSGPLQIGDANVEAVAVALKNLGICAVGHDVGGTKGRRIVFDCASGEMTVECTGCPAHTI
jgi:chemotaxis protein CheD